MNRHVHSTAPGHLARSVSGADAVSPGEATRTRRAEATGAPNAPPPRSHAAKDAYRPVELNGASMSSDTPRRDRRGYPGGPAPGDGRHSDPAPSTGTPHRQQ